MTQRPDPATSPRIRFLPKKIGEGRGAKWRIYDLQRGSFPYRSDELGAVAQDLDTEPEAQAECDRLTAAHGYLDLKARARFTSGVGMHGKNPD